MKTLYLIRHGQTLFNQQKKIQGFCDSPLTELGIHQAQTARKHIDDLNIQFDEAHCSTSERAIDTLKIITDIPFESHKDLREWNFGRLEEEGIHHSHIKISLYSMVVKMKKTSINGSPTRS